MSLKKQVKQLKFELHKKDEVMSTLKGGKYAAKIQELYSEIDMYKDELMRMTQVLAETERNSKVPTEMTEKHHNSDIMEPCESN